MVQTTIDFPARRSDPVTSKLSAAELILSGQRDSQQAAVLQLVRENPGMTVQELARQSFEAYCPMCGNRRGGVTSAMIFRRISELHRMELVEPDAEAKRCSVTGRLARTWRIGERHGKE